MTLRIPTAILFCFLQSFVLAQSAHKPAPSSNDRKLVAIRVTGSQRYTQQEIIAASGLEIGKVASEDDFQQAVKRLGEGGFFSKAGYSYAYASTGTKLDLQLADTEKLVPAHFENFVWFTDEDLVAQIHAHLPLFKGEVPVGGTFCDQVSDVLQALLVQKNLSARAEYFRDSKNNAGPVDVVNFRASGVTLEIEDVQFSGAGPDELPALKTAAEKLIGKDYVRTEIEAYASSKLLPVYLQRGFLKASITGPQAKVTKETDNATELAVLFTVDPGRQYKIASLAWEGNRALKAEKLQNLLHAKVGDTANAQQLQTDLDAIHKLYTTVGYMEASVKAQPELDDAAGTVSYKLQVEEGDVFHLGDLDIQGLDAKTVDRLREAWTLRETDPYDSTYPMRFFEQTVKLLSRDVTWTVSVHEGVNEKEKTVDVTLRYGLKPSS
jgi:outer membrane protein assembly factor BamA